MKSNLPIFSPNNFYVYFNDLSEKSCGYPNIDRIRNGLYRTAETYFKSILDDSLIFDLSNQPEKIKNAIEFLRQVAENERRKEINLITRYLKEIENDIPPVFKKGQKFNDIIKRLKNFSDRLSSNQPVVKEGIDNFYQEIVTYINMIRRNINDFKLRINQISQKNISTQKELANRSMLFRARGELDTMLKSAIGIQQREVKNSYASKIREQVFDFLVKDGKLVQNLDLQNNLLGILSGLIIELEHYIETHGTPEIDKINENGTNQLQNLINDYFKQEDTFFLKETKKIISGRTPSEELTEIIKDLEKSMGLDYKGLGNKSKTLKERQAEIDKQVINNTAGARYGERNYISKKLKSLGLTNLLNSYSHITWTVQSKNKSDNSSKNLYGILYEALADILESGGRRVGGVGAVDRISCSIIGRFDSDTDNNKISKKVTEIAKAMTKDYYEERQDRLEDNSSLVKKQNEDIDKFIGQLETEAKNLKIPKKDLFIYHESLKLYATMEETVDGERRASKFHGREMLALNLLDELYSIADLEVVKLMDKEALKNIILNLPSAAVASSLKGPVERYFTIFAGLLMFSDIRNMALEISKEAQTKLKYKDFKNIHLYLLNDTYYPASFILTYVYESLISGINSIPLNYSIKVNINTNSATKIINKYTTELDKARANHEKSPYKPEDWEEQANQIANAIKIEISFLSSFINFTTNLSKQIN